VTNLDKAAPTLVRTWRLDLDSDTHAPALARHSLRGWLRLVTCRDDTKIDVTILVSEFVTEAATSDATHVSISMIFDEGRLRIDVHAREEAPAGGGGRTPIQTATGPSFADRIADIATDNWGRTRQPDTTHAWAEILC
jgi:hypothetical protein